MDFITKTLKRPARIAALGLLSLFLAAPAAQAGTQQVVSGNADNPAGFVADLSGRSKSPGTVSKEPVASFDWPDELTPEGDDVTLTAHAASGYAFDSWLLAYWPIIISDISSVRYVTNFASTVAISYDASIADDTQIRVTARFAPTYDVTLNPCEGKFPSGATNKVRVVYGHGYGKLDSPGLDGYDFDGWFTQADGGEEVTEDTIVTNVSTHTLYAHWSGIESTLTFDPMGGAFADSNEVTRTVTYGSPYGQLPEVSKGGYSLVGWFKDLDYSSTRISASGKVDEASPFTVFAKWIPINYTVAFDGNGATSGTMDPVSCEYGDPAFALPANKFRRAGAAFTGWNTRNDGSGNDYADQEKVSTITTNAAATVTLYAQWRKSEYTVAFDANGGEGEMPPAVFPREVERILPSNAFVRVGYDFDHWHDSLNNRDYPDGATVVDLADEGATNTLAAVWAPVNYTISFKRGSATAKGEMDDLPCVYDTPTNLPPCTFTNPLGTFLGWALDPAAAEPDFTNRAEVVNFAVAAGAVVPLYAVWDSSLTDLSRAIGCDTLQLESTAANRWTVYTNAAGEVCLMSGYFASATPYSSLTTSVDGPGTLTFKWSVSGIASPAKDAYVVTWKGL